jgi:hypothetical protein
MKPITDDERENLPSASEIHRVIACPGYLSLKATLPPKKEAPSEIAERGNRIHAALAIQLSPNNLDDEERRIYDRCKEIEEEVVARIFTNQPVAIFERETRYWFTRQNQKIFSGKPDVVIRAQGQASVIDYKTGYAEVIEAAGNAQLRALALLIQGDCQEIYAVVIQPNFKPGYSIAKYTAADLTSARVEILTALDAAAKPDAKRIPGKHCDYCPCRGQCPEGNQAALDIFPDYPKAIQLYDDQALSDFLVACDNIGVVKTVKAAQDEMKRRIKERGPIDSWTLEPSGFMQPITDPTTVFNRAVEKGVSEADFMATVDIGKGELKKALKKATGLKGGALDEAFEQLVIGCTTKTEKAPSLSRAPEPVEGLTT